MLPSCVQSRARPLRAGSAGRPSCDRATSSPYLNAGSSGGLRLWRICRQLGGLPDLGGWTRHAGAGPAAYHRRPGRRLHRRCGAIARGRAGFPDHPPVPQLLLGRTLDDRSDRDAGRAGTCGGNWRSLRRGHLAPTWWTAAGWAFQPPVGSRRGCRPGRDAQAHADLSRARDGRTAELGATRSAWRRSRPLDAAGGHLAAPGCQPARRGSHPDQPGDQAAALRRGAGRSRMAAADAAVVRPLGAHAYSFSLSRPISTTACRPRLHRPATAAMRRCNGGSTS